MHHLVDGVSEDRVAAIGEVLRAAMETRLSGEQANRLAEQLRARSELTDLVGEPIHRFASAGTLSAEPDLAKRVEEIVRADSPAVRPRDPGRHRADRGRYQRP